MEEERNLKMIRNIKDNYCQVEKFIVEQLYMKNDLHGTTIGTEREDIWEQLFEMVLPKKFVMEHSVFIIDSNGNVSNEVDLAIMDETYTPYIFRYGRLKFIPIEAVATVVECKSKNVGEKKIKIWQKRIEELRTRGKSIARMANQIVDSTVATQKSTRPIRILCVLENVKDNIKNLFDFVLIAKRGNEDKKERARIEIICNDSRELYEWYKDLNFNKVNYDREGKTDEDKLGKISLKDYEVLDENEENISLLTFNFQLNQLLMLINNPILFPHRAYVKMFKGEEQEIE